MSLTHDDVKKIAHLARLSFTDEEITKLNGELSKILTLIQHMDQEDTSQVPALAHPLETTQPLRADVVSEQNQRDLFLKNAPNAIMGLYIVPQVIETEG